MSIKEEMDFGGLVPRNYSLHLRMILELQKFQFQVLFSMSFRFYVGLLLLYASCVLSWQRHLALSIGLNFLI